MVPLKNVQQKAARAVLDKSLKIHGGESDQILEEVPDERRVGSEKRLSSRKLINDHQLIKRQGHAHANNRKINISISKDENDSDAYEFTDDILESER